ncbi:hypothetical protein [Mesorhizobium sp. M1322]
MSLLILFSVRASTSMAAEGVQIFGNVLLVVAIGTEVSQGER